MGWSRTARVGWGFTCCTLTTVTLPLGTDRAHARKAAPGPWRCDDQPGVREPSHGRPDREYLCLRDAPPLSRRAHLFQAQDREFRIRGLPGQRLLSDQW